MRVLRANFDSGDRRTAAETSLFDSHGATSALMEVEQSVGHADAKMPHDLQHFIVERELAIKHGVFGFLAAGGESGGDERGPGRAASRRRRKGKRRDLRMIRRGDRADGDNSEAATFLCWCEWLRRSVIAA